MENLAAQAAKSRSEQAEKMVAQLEYQLQFLRLKAGSESPEAKKLIQANEKLRCRRDELKRQLEQIELRNGGKPVPMPETKTSALPSSAQIIPTKTTGTEIVGAPPAKKRCLSTSEGSAVSEPAPTTGSAASFAAPAAATAAVAAATQAPAAAAATPTNDKASKKKEKAAKTEKAGGAAGGKKPQEAAEVDFSRLNVRVGKIVSVRRHPDADGLFVEEVDVGEGENRTICSGLVKFCKLEDLQDRIAIFCVNLKPAVFRGIPSQGMILCAERPTGEACEVIRPPAGAAIGDRVTVPGFPGEPDKQLNPKRKIVEKLKPDLQTNDECTACYKGVPFTIEGKGICRVDSLTNCQIK